MLGYAQSEFDSRTHVPNALCSSQIKKSIYLLEWVLAGQVVLHFPCGRSATSTTYSQGPRASLMCPASYYALKSTVNGRLSGGLDGWHSAVQTIYAMIRPQMKQPAAGIVATPMVIAISLGFVSLFDFPTFAGWVSYYLLCIIPMQIVMAVTWGCGHPDFAAARSQPAKGVLLTLLTLVVGVVVAVTYFATVGGSVSPPSPMLMQCTIVSVVITFWFAIMWGGWPFKAVIKNPVPVGLTQLAACYVANYLLFRLFFDYGFMQGAPVYVPALDPHGLFNAWNALVFYVTALGIMFLVLHFDLWPLTKSPRVMQQPVLGIVWTIAALVLAGIAFWAGVTMMGMDVVAFLVRVPVPFIFGTIVVLNMFQGSLFGKLTQPLKGLLNAIAAAVIGTVLAWVYGVLAPTVTGTLNAGPPSYDFEIWLATSLLSVTFPFLIFHAEFFKLWPLKKPD